MPEPAEAGFYRRGPRGSHHSSRPNMPYVARLSPMGDGATIIAIDALVPWPPIPLPQEELTL
jgi:transglutaminase/protease-like cytokinesis protein 3